DHHDEHQHQHFHAHAGRELLAIERPHHPAEPSERRARDEHADEQPADVVTERLDHFAVLDAGADQKADFRAVEHQQHAGEHHEADDHRNDPVALDGDVAEHD